MKRLTSNSPEGNEKANKKLTWWYHEGLSFLLGTKALTLNPNDWKKNVLGSVWGIICLMYHIGICYYLVQHILLNVYLRPDHKAFIMKDHPLHVQVIVFISYLLIDMVYPVSTILLWMFERSKLVEKFENELIDIMGSDVYNKAHREIFNYYTIRYVYALAHVLVIYFWLNSMESFRGFLCNFFAIYFGIPHVLMPLTLLSQIYHVVHLFTARIEAFQARIDRYEADDLHDQFVKIRVDAFDLCKRLEFVTGWISLFLIAAIVVHGIAAHTFAC